MAFSQEHYQLAKDIQSIDKKIKVKLTDLIINLLKN